MSAEAGNTSDDRLFEYELDEKQQALRDLFVTEYLKDYDAFQAALRCGFLSTFAVEWGRKLLQESYVQRQIAEFARAKHAENDAEAKLAHIENMRKLSLTGPESSRVSAGKEYAELMGWKKDNDAETSAERLVDAFKDLAQRLPV